MVINFTVYFGNAGMELEATFEDAPPNMPELFVKSLVGDLRHLRATAASLSQTKDKIVATIEGNEEAVAFVRSYFASNPETDDNVHMELEWPSPAVVRGRMVVDETHEETLARFEMSETLLPYA